MPGTPKTSETTNEGKINTNANIYEVYALGAITAIGLVSYFGWMIYEVTANSDKINSLTLTYLIVIGAIIFSVILVIIIKRKLVLQIIEASKRELMAVKKNEYGEEALTAYWFTFFTGVIFVVFLGLFAYYSAAGSDNVMGAEYEKPLLPGASTGDDPLPSREY